MDQVAKLTGIHAGRLRKWVTQGHIAPTRGTGIKRSPYRFDRVATTAIAIAYALRREGHPMSTASCVMRAIASLSPAYVTGSIAAGRSLLLFAEGESLAALWAPSILEQVAELRDHAQAHGVDVEPIAVDIAPMWSQLADAIEARQHAAAEAN